MEWLNEILLCPETLKPVSGTWPNLYTADEKKIPIDELGIISGKTTHTLSKKFHDNMKQGAALRKMQEDRLHQVKWETPYYSKNIEKMIDGLDTSLPVLDLGCGDGRFTKLLIDKGYEKIVCLDSDYRLLSSLHQYAVENNFRENIVLINSNIENLPFAKDSIGLALAIGVLYYTNEHYNETISTIYNILKKNAFLIPSEPDFEGMLFRSLLFENLNDVFENFEQHKFKEVAGETEFKFKLHSKEELIKIYTDTGFTVEAKHGITMFHNFLRIQLVRNKISGEDINKYYEQFWPLFNYLDEHGSLFKHIIWKLKK